MPSEDCPVCGHQNQGCTGNTRHIVTESGERTTKELPRMPQQRVRFGKVGYIGAVETYDPAHPAIRMVRPEVDAEPTVKEEEPQQQEPEREVPIVGSPPPKAAKTQPPKQKGKK